MVTSQYKQVIYYAVYLKQMSITPQLKIVKETSEESNTNFLASKDINQQ